MNKSILDIESGILNELLPKSLDMGMYDFDGEIVYVVFDPKYGAMEFTSIAGLREHVVKSRLSSLHARHTFRWVTDNEPVGLDCIDWYDAEDGSNPMGRYIIDVQELQKMYHEIKSCIRFQCRRSLLLNHPKV